MVSKNSFDIKNMFDNIAVRYNFFNNLMTFGLHKIIKNTAVKILEIKDDANVLDVCTGTGDVANIIQKKKKNVKVFGLDFSSNMLNIARKKFGNKITFVEASACDMPFEDDFFDYVTISFGLRNIEDEICAIDEMKRVLKKGGKLMHLDFARGNFVFDIFFDFIVFLLTKFLNAEKSAYDYLVKSKNEFKKPKELIKMFEDEGFLFVKNKKFLFNMLQAQVFEKK